MRLKPRVYTGKLPGRVHNLVLEWADIHRSELMDDWLKARAVESLSNIKPLE